MPRPFFIWLILIIGVTWFFSYLLDNFNNPNQKVIEIVNQEGNPEVVLKRNRRGHYVASGELNDKRVVFFLDSGATAVGIPEKIAKKLNLKRNIRVEVGTANGVVDAYSTRLDSVSIGNIKMQDVGALIMPNMSGDEILLGMSFLKHLELVQKGETLTLRVPAD